MKLEFTATATEVGRYSYTENAVKFEVNSNDDDIRGGKIKLSVHEALAQEIGQELYRHGRFKITIETID
jgi:hypothetical protein